MILQNNSKITKQRSSERNAKLSITAAEKGFAEKVTGMI